MAVGSKLETLCIMAVEDNELIPFTLREAASNAIWFFITSDSTALVESDSSMNHSQMMLTG